MDQKQAHRRYSILIDAGLWLVVLFIFIAVRPNLFSVITPFVYALVLAYLLNPAVSFLQKKGLHRILAIVIVFLVVVLVLSGIGMSFIPRLAQDISGLINNLPEVVEFVEQFINNFREGNLSFMPQFILDFVDIDEELTKLSDGFRNSLDNLYSLLISSTGTLLDIIMTPIITFYYLKDKDSLNNILLKIIGIRHRSRVRRFALEINKVLGGFIKGQLIIAAFVGILTGIGCWVIGVPNSLTIGLVAGVTNIIPYFGPWIGGIMPVILALMNRPIMALWVIILIVVVQQIEAGFISPQIMSHSVGMHPLLVIFSVLFFGSLFGVVGMIIGVPLTGSIKIIVKHVLDFRSRYRMKIITDI